LLVCVLRNRVVTRAERAACKRLSKVHSASECRERAGGVFVEPPLSFPLLEGLLDVGVGDMEDTGLGPIGNRERVEEIAQLVPGLEAVEPHWRSVIRRWSWQWRNLRSRQTTRVFGRLLRSDVSLGDVIGHRKAAVVEKALQGVLLVDGVRRRVIRITSPNPVVLS
jgi:hypothetical protein